MNGDLGEEVTKALARSGLQERQYDDRITAIVARLGVLEAAALDSALDMKLIRESLHAMRWLIKTGKWIGGAVAVLTGAYHTGGALALKLWEVLSGR